MLTDAAVQDALDGIDLGLLALYSAYSATGTANEVSGGSYARQASTYAAASGRSRALTGTESFTGLPAGAVVAWVGRWNAAGTQFQGMTPNGAAPKSFQVDVANNRVLCEGHGLANGDRVVFYGGTAPGNLTIGTHYFVVGVTAGDPDYFQVATTAGGAAIDITGQPGVGCVCSPIVIETYTAAGGTFNVSGDTVELPGAV